MYILPWLVGMVCWRDEGFYPLPKPATLWDCMPSETNRPYWTDLSSETKWLTDPLRLSDHLRLSNHLRLTDSLRLSDPLRLSDHSCDWWATIWELFSLWEFLVSVAPVLLAGSLPNVVLIAIGQYDVYCTTPTVSIRRSIPLWFGSWHVICWLYKCGYAFFSITSFYYCCCRAILVGMVLCHWCWPWRWSSVVGSCFDKRVPIICCCCCCWCIHALASR